MNNIWPLHNAKSKFNELVERAMAQGAQVVTLRGKKVIVVLPYEEYERLTQPKENLSQFLLNSPLAGSELEIDRDKSLPRNAEVNLTPAKSR